MYLLSRLLSSVHSEDYTNLHVAGPTKHREISKEVGSK